MSLVTEAEPDESLVLEPLQASWGYTEKSYLWGWGWGAEKKFIWFMVPGGRRGRSSKLANPVVSTHRKQRGQAGSGTRFPQSPYPSSSKALPP